MILKVNVPGGSSAPMVPSSLVSFSLGSNNGLFRISASTDDQISLFASGLLLMLIARKVIVTLEMELVSLGFALAVSVPEASGVPSVPGAGAPGIGAPGIPG